MRPKQFIRGQKVYCEGSSQVDGVYFITGGEFEVTQKSDKNKPRDDSSNAQAAVKATSKQRIQELRSRSQAIHNRGGGDQ